MVRRCPDHNTPTLTPIHSSHTPLTGVWEVSFWNSKKFFSKKLKIGLAFSEKMW